MQAHASPASIDVAVDQRDTGARIAYVTINNARRLNTLTSALMNDFAAAHEELARDEGLRAVVITGAGEKAFCGGADIDEMSSLDATTARKFITSLHRCCQVVRDLPVPVIARIQGYALGAGLELAASCDLRIAADTAVLGMPEVKLGIPSVIEAALLPTLVGWGRTREMLLLGETFTAREAADWGLLERVVPKPELDQAVESCIQSLLSAGPCAIRLQKKLIQSWEQLPLRAAIEAGIDAFCEAWQGEEPRLTMNEFQAARRARSSRESS